MHYNTIRLTNEDLLNIDICIKKIYPLFKLCLQNKVVKNAKHLKVRVLVDLEYNNIFLSSNYSSRRNYDTYELDKDFHCTTTLFTFESKLEFCLYPPEDQQKFYDYILKSKNFKSLVKRVKDNMPNTTQFIFC
jgi:hypothetical protein